MKAKGETLRDHEIDVALSSVKGENSIHMLRDLLKSRNLLTVDDNVIDQWELELTRKHVAAFRKRQVARGGSVQKELIHLSEVKPDGSKRDYYKPYRELTAAEIARLLTYWHKYIGYGRKQFDRYYDPAEKKFSREKIQKLLPFALPEPAEAIP